MPSTMPLRPDRGWVWVTLFMFYGLGLGLIAKGMQIGSVGTMAFGALLVFAGVYYSVQWFRAKRHDREILKSDQSHSQRK